MDNHALPSILAHHGAHGRVHLAPTSGSCATGCAFGSDHPHATCQTASAQSSFEVLHTPWNIPSSPYHASDIPLADLVAQYGTASSTAWLDSAKYKLWRPSQPIPESTFQPVQGYIRKGASESIRSLEICILIAISRPCHYRLGQPTRILTSCSRKDCTCIHCLRRG